MTTELRVVSCATCPCGRASGVGAGGRCPLVDRHKKRGEYLYLEGEPATHVWFVKRGAVVLTRRPAVEPGDVSEAPRAVRRAGAFLGLEALVRTTYLDTALVTAPSVLCGGRREEVDAWLGPVGSPARMALEQVLLTECEDEPRATTSDGSAPARVARWLLHQTAGALEAPVPRRYTAGLLGMVPETLSRALRKLAATGAIAVTRQSVRVTDVEALRRAAGADAGDAAVTAAR